MLSTIAVHRDSTKLISIYEAMHVEAYIAHIDQLKAEWRQLMRENGFDAVVVHAGANQTYYGDDQEPPFHAFGHFLRWVPQSDCEHAALLISLDSQPVLLWYAPSDYWYLPSDAPEFCNEVFIVQTFAELDDLQHALHQQTRSISNVAHLGNVPTSNETDSDPSTTDRLLRQLDYQRAFKTEFEQLCIKDATSRGVLGHHAAAQAFADGGSEYEIHLAYLRASSQHEAELPYPSIVAMNSHAATLHYQRYDREPAAEIHSLLIDAGAKVHCYHSDITRTYAASTNDEFAELIDAVDQAQQGIIKQITLGKSYLDLHDEMSKRIAAILSEHEFVTCSPTTAYESRLVDAFFPHGLGHLLGLQTHDVGGLILEKDGHQVPPHSRYESLRLMREIEPNMVFTIEPGIYFIPSLLAGWQDHQDVNWSRVERFISYGGVRVEDNVLVSPSGPINLTREAFSAASADA